MSERDERLTASQRFRAVARDVALDALRPERVRSALGTKLVGAGLSLVCFACGVDYFANADQVQRVVTNLARDSGQAELANTVEGAQGSLAALKRQLTAHLEGVPRWAIVVGAVLPGVALLGAGLRIKTRDAATRADGLRDVGRVLLAPGVVGAVVFMILSWRGAAALRVPIRSYLDQWATRDGGTLWSMATNHGSYAWTWDQVPGVAIIGVLLWAVWLTGFLVRKRTGRAVEAARRSAAFGAMFCFGFCALVTIVSVMTYGGGLNVLTWPWKVNKIAFLVTLAFMSVGGGLMRTGASLRRAEAAAAKEAEGELRKA